MEVLEKIDVRTVQADQPGEVENNTDAGELEGGVDTVTTEEKGTDFSIENIGTEATTEKTDEEILAVSDKAQERYSKRIGNAIREKNIAMDEARKAKAKVKELEAAALIPKEKPRAPLRENYEDGEKWQDDMDKYQTDIAVYHSSVNKSEVQERENVERVRINDDRLLDQMDKLQAKYPGINVNDTIASVANVDGFGNAAQHIHNSEYSAKIALYLATNPTELEKMASLNNADVINREIGKLEAQFSNLQKKTTKAPKPLEPAEGKDSTVVKDINEIKDDDEWFRAYKKQESARIRGQNT